MDMSSLNYFNLLLISMLYFWASSTALSVGIGYYTLYRPIIAGMITGLIFGDFKTGALAGSVVNIIYIDFVSTGGSLKGDQCLTAIIAAFCAVVFELSIIQSAAFSFVFGFLGILNWKYRLSINSIFVKAFDNKYKNGKNPDITVYNTILPQLLLYFMSSVVILISLVFVMLFKDVLQYEIVKDILFIAGIYLIIVSIANVLFKINNKMGNYAFFISAALILLLDLKAIFIVIIVAIIFVVFSAKDFKTEFTYNNLKENRYLNKFDLFYSWFVWMNVSHACYNYERLQGMAFAQSIKNIIKKLYKENLKSSEIIYNHAEYFNTEPNIGTPILGIIISLEEERFLGKGNIDISYVKKGMMGIAAGLGDSFTQVVLTPFYISTALLLCFDGNFYLSILSVIFLGINILYISYSGWIQGYYLGRESLLKRLKTINNSNVKKYFPIFFEGILGACIGKLINNNTILSEVNLNYVFLAVFFAALYIIVSKNKGKILRRS